MATISTIGLRFMVFTDQLEAGVKRVERNLTAVGLAAQGVNAVFRNIQAPAVWWKLIDLGARLAAGGLVKVAGGLLRMAPLLSVIRELARAAMFFGQAVAAAAAGARTLFNAMTVPARMLFTGLRISLRAFLGDIGLVFAAFGRWVVWQVTMSKAMKPLVDLAKSFWFPFLEGAQLNIAMFARWIAALRDAAGFLTFAAAYAWDAYSTKVAGVLTRIASGAAAAFARVWQEWKHVWGIIGDVVGEAAAPVLGRVGRLLDLLGSAFARVWQEWQHVWGLIGDVTGEALSAIRGRFASYFLNPVDGALTRLLRRFRMLGDELKKAFAGFRGVDMLKGTFAAIGNFMTKNPAFAAMKKAAMDQLAKIGPALSGMLGALGSAFSAAVAAGGGLLAVLSGVASVIGGVLVLAFAAVLVWITAFIAAVLVLATLYGLLITGALAYAAALLKLAVAGIENVVATDRMARQFGIAYNGMKALLELARRSGIDGNVFERWLGRLEVQLGGVRAGAYDALRTFRLLNIDGRALADMPIDQAFTTLIDHMRSIPNSFEQARIAEQIFGRDFRKLLAIVNNPLFKSTADVLKQLKGTGQLLDPHQVLLAEKASEAMTRLHGALEGVAIQVGIQLAPMIEAVLNHFIDLVSEGEGLQGMFRGLGQHALTFADTAIQGFAKLLDIFVAFKPALVAVGTAMLAVAKTASIIIATTLRAAALLPGMGGLGLDKAANSLDAGTKLAADLATEGLARLDVLLRNGSPSPAILAKWAELKKKIQDVMDEAGRGGPGGALGAALGAAGAAAVKLSNHIPHLVGRLKELQDAQGRFREMPLLAKFNDDMRQLDELLSTKLLTGATKLGAAAGGALGIGAKALNDATDEHALATLKLVDELEGKLGTQIKNPPSLRVDSSEALSVLATAFNARTNQNPQERIARLLEEARNRDELRNKYAKELRDAIVNIKKVQLP